MTLASIVASPAMAAHLELQIDGVEGPFKDAAVAAAGMQDYASRDITAAQAHRLFDRASTNIASALEPYGYYNATADGELKETPAGFVAVMHVHVGEPTTVATFDVAVPEPARDEKIVRKALATFTPKKGERLDHANYEKSKAAIQAALLASGYLDAKLTAKTVEVSRSDNRASIHLAWDVGRRYRYGKTTFTGGQFQEGFLDRYIPWHEGDFYSQDDLLRLQQQLIDADYFAVVDVQPEPSQLHDGIVPILVTLGPAKRNVYTAGVFLDTDIGFGVRGGLTRRWVNDKGHKLKVEVQLAQKLRTASVIYSIPLPGPNNRAYNVGVNYLNENTDTTISHTESVVANETRDWLGFTRTLGLHLLTGTFDILDPNGNKALEEHGNTTLLYPELVLEKKKADDPLVRARRLFAHGYRARRPETDFGNRVRAGARRCQMDQGHRQQSTPDLSRHRRCYASRRFRQAPARIALLRRRRSFDPRLFVSGHRSDECRRPHHRRRGSRRRQRRIRILFHARLGHRRVH